jgi:glycosyltransferase involved in cell wall biosynthesis
MVAGMIVPSVQFLRNSAVLFINYGFRADSFEDFVAAMSEAIRVLHVNSGNLYGGVETFLATLFQGRMAAPDMQPEIAICFPGRHADEIRSDGGIVHDLAPVRRRYPWTVWRARRRLRRLLQANPPSVVVCHQPWIQVLFGPLCTRLRIPWVAYFHNALEDRELDRQAKRLSPTMIIAPSEHTLASAKPFFPGAIAHVVANPLSLRTTQRPQLNAGQRETLRQSLYAAPADVVVLQASRVESWKGPDQIIRALSRLKSERPWRFWFAGAPQRPHEQALMMEMKRIADAGGIADRVYFLGHRDDVPDLMQAADLYVQGNRGPEGFGLSFAEAMWNAVPVITTRLGAAPEVVAEGCGILTPPDDIETLSDAMRRLINDDTARRAMGQAARRHVHAICDPSRQISRLAEKLGQIARSEEPSQ